MQYVKLWGTTNPRINEKYPPSRLYPILYLINNLRDVIATAKRVMIKEKIDRQKMDQSSATPFMQMNDCNHSLTGPVKEE